jgi:hypothetical protein
VALLLANQEWWVRQAAKDALVELGPGVAAELVMMLDHPDAFARNSLAEVLQNVGLVDRLIADVETRSFTVSHQSEQVLRKVLLAGGPQFSTAVFMQMPPERRRRFNSLLVSLETETRSGAEAA